MASVAAVPGGEGKCRSQKAECRRENSPIAEYRSPVLRSSTAEGEGSEGDSVGETPTGATGTVAVPKGLGCNRLRAGLKTSWGPVFAASVAGQASCLPVVAASSRQLVFDWRIVPEVGAGCPRNRPPRCLPNVRNPNVM